RRKIQIFGKNPVKHFFQKGDLAPLPGPCIGPAWHEVVCLAIGKSPVRLRSKTLECIAQGERT
ncbi:MAG: hypothetical protein RQ899_11235, partial [Pseudomonadales bacterium]|nr:hypothetical protein [Pseudomonadales bacterium]